MNESNLTPQAPGPHDLENLMLSIKDLPPAREALKALAQSILDHPCMQSNTNDQQPDAKQDTQAQLETLLALVKDNPSAQEAFAGMAQFILNHLSPQPSTGSHKSDKPKLAPDLLCVNCGKHAVVKLDNHHYECRKCGARTLKPPNPDNNLSVPSSADAQKSGKPKLAPDLFSNHCGEQAVPTKPTDLCEMRNDSACGEIAQPQEPSAAQKPRRRFLPLPPPPVCINDYLTILLVGDDEAVTRMLKHRFKNEGFLVRCACDAENGFRVYESSGPFVLVMVDFSLPNNGGVELGKAIRQRDPSQRMVMTAFAYKSQEEVKRPPELMDIPVLTDVCQLSNLLDSLRPWANREEVERAIKGLSQADLCRIRKVAELKGWHDWEDLLSETQLRALTGADDAHNGKRKHVRRWNKRIDFVTFLIGSMRGMNFHDKEKSRKLEPLDPAYDFASGEKRADQRLVDEADLAETLQLFRDDPEATMMLQDFACGMDKQDIKSKRPLSDRQFAAIMKRIRSKLSGRNDN